jgi:hypothetical protein
MYSLVYDGESETYNFPLLDDMENGELRIVPLDSEFIVGRQIIVISIPHIYTNDIYIIRML